MTSSNKFTEEQIKDMVSMYSMPEYSTTDISKKYNCAKNTINRILRKNGVTFNLKQKISFKNTGNSYKKGKKISIEARQKMSKSRKGCKPTTLGKVYTEKEKLNISNGVKKAFSLNPTKRMIEARKIGTEKINKARIKCKNLLRRVVNLTGNKKATKTYEALGYTEKELISHISALFKDGMTWEKRESFHIDHIIPISYFIKNGVTDPKIINALSNLQPLYPMENRLKSDTYSEFK